MNWLRANLSEYYESFNPGLSLSDINQISGTLNLLLPCEVIELYHWKNGTNMNVPSTIFPMFEFQPLFDVVDILRECIDDPMIDSLFTFNNQPIFPFMMSDGYICASLLRPNVQLETSPIIYIGKHGGNQYEAFDSLTSMIEGMAEGFMYNAYYLDSDDYIDEYHSKIKNILCRNNPKLVRKLIVDLEKAFQTSELDFSTEQLISNTLCNLERFSPPQMQEVLLKSLEICQSHDEKRWNLMRERIKKYIQSDC